LRGIFDYIEEHSEQNAPRMVEQILNEIDGLTRMAMRFKRVGRSKKRGSPVHAMVVHPYIVYYRVEEAERMVFVLSVRHGARRQPRRFP
jgi:plasmid stabilization system protein ParE